MITTVHDCQVVSDDELPLSLMSDHDLPVDIIVTPTKIINVRNPLKKPSCGVLWNQISSQKLKEMPVLEKLESYRQYHLCENV